MRKWHQSEALLLIVLDIDRAQQGTHAEEVAATLHALSEMLRGWVSSCHVTPQTLTP